MDWNQQSHVVDAEAGVRRPNIRMWLSLCKKESISCDFEQGCHLREVEESPQVLVIICEFGDVLMVLQNSSVEVSFMR